MPGRITRHVVGWGVGCREGGGGEKGGEEEVFMEERVGKGEGGPIIEGGRWEAWI